MPYSYYQFWEAIDEGQPLLQAARRHPVGLLCSILLVGVGLGIAWGFTIVIFSLEVPLGTR